MAIRTDRQIDRRPGRQTAKQTEIVNPFQPFWKVLKILFFLEKGDIQKTDRMAYLHIEIIH